MLFIKLRMRKKNNNQCFICKNNSVKRIDKKFICNACFYKILLIVQK